VKPKQSKIRKTDKTQKYVFSLSAKNKETEKLNFALPSKN